ncbi:MAG: hypothetical protein IKP76_03680 [Bacilli bacterium]|nr:hypothetical protein [Bacilli bacterium]
MNVEELKQYRNKLLRNKDNKYICINIDFTEDEDIDWDEFIKIEGKPMTREEIMNNTNTEEGVKEFERVMADIVDKSVERSYDFDLIYLYSNYKFYCNISYARDLFDMFYKLANKIINEKAMYYFLRSLIKNGNIIISNVPINFNDADVVAYEILDDDNNEIERDINTITQEYNEEDYCEWKECTNIKTESKNIIVNIEEFNRIIESRGYYSRISINPDMDNDENFIHSIINSYDYTCGRRIALADFRNLKKTKKNN